MSIIERTLSAMEVRSKKMAELAELLSLNSSTVANWKTRNTDPPARYIAPICEFLDVSFEWLLSGEGDMNRVRSSNQKIAAEESKLLEDFKKLDELNKARIMERIGMLVEMKEETERQTTQKTQENRILQLSQARAVRRMATPALNSGNPINNLKKQKSMTVFTIKASAGTGNPLDGDSPYEILSFDADEIPYGADHGIRITGDSMEPMIHDEEIVWVATGEQIENGDIRIFILNNDALCKKLHVDANGGVQLVSLNKKYKPIDIYESSDLRPFGKVLKH